MGERQFAIGAKSSPGLGVTIDDFEFQIPIDPTDALHPTNHLFIIGERCLLATLCHVVARFLIPALHLDASGGIVWIAPMVERDEKKIIVDISSRRHHHRHLRRAACRVGSSHM